MHILHELLNRRFTRIGFLLVLDAVIVTLSYYAAIWLRVDLLEARVSYLFDNQYYLHTLPSLLAIRIACNAVFRQYNWSFSQAGIDEGMRLALSIISGCAAFILVGHVFTIFSHPPPRSVYVLESALTFAGMFILRFIPGYLLTLSSQRLQLAGSGALRTLIYDGGGTGGELLARELMRTHGHGCAVVGFLDDNPAHLNSFIHGVKVLGGIQELPSILKDTKIEQILLVGDEISGSVTRALVDVCGPRRIRLKSVPSYRNMLTGSSGNPMKDIDPESLLDRRQVDFTSVDMEGFLRGKTILVTGAGGTIGSELCRQVAGYDVTRLLMVDIDENALFYLKMELDDLVPDCPAVLLLGSVRDELRMQSIMKEYHPEIVFHAAAHKHVPIVELAPVEAIRNNVLGTYEVAECSIVNGVERFVLVSTDKAAACANVLGMSKRLAELTALGLNKRGGTRFQVVRFGNVLGSSGSLLEIIRHQMSHGGPVTVTHPDMERYFMTIREAVGLILVATALDEGTINVLDMGARVKVDTLVRQILYLAGFVPGQDMEIQYTKPRPGELLREVLYRDGETPRNSSFSGITIIDETQGAFDLTGMIADAHSVVERQDASAAQAFLKQWTKYK